MTEKMEIANRLYNLGFSVRFIQVAIGYKTKQSLEAKINKERKNGLFLPLRSADYKPRLSVHDL